MQELNDLIVDCQHKKREAQRELYERFSPRLMGICLRYTRSRVEAEDLLQDVFVKIFKQIKKFKGSGSFEGWLCRIAVNTAITNYHKHKNLKSNSNLEDHTDELVQLEDATQKLSNMELLAIINELPDIYRVVFNLYAIEGYTHKEIAKMLKISEGTSKSQLSRARRLLQKKLAELKIVTHDSTVV